MSLVKPVFRCADNYKKQFSQSRCLLTISVGQEVHEAEKFETTIELVNKSFKSCILLLDDSLQRHTMALNEAHTADFYYDLSIKEGDLWLQRNQKYLTKLTILDKIIRWDSWLQHPAYLEKKQQIQQLIADDCSYRLCFEDTVNEFLTRYFRRLTEDSNFDATKAKQLCLDYLIEECTALCLWQETNCQFEVYPNSRNAVMAETHRRFIEPYHPQLLNAVAIKFKNRKQLKPQWFSSILDETSNIAEELAVE